MTEIAVGRADWRNSHHLWELRLAYLAEEIEREPKFAIENPEQMARLMHQTHDFLLSDGRVIFMAYRGEEPIGYMILELGDYVGYYQQTGIRVAGFYVIPTERKGLAGRKLLRAGYDAVRKNGYPRTQAVVTVGNDAMRNQLERNGYRLVSVIYEREEQSHGRHDVGTEAKQEIYGSGSHDPQRRSDCDVVGSAVSSGPTTGS
jgi:GNAT superfamily N-acetyltransferase